MGLDLKSSNVTIAKKDAPTKMTFGERAKDVLQSGVSGLGKTVSGILSAPEELTNLAGAGFNKVSQGLQKVGIIPENINIPDKAPRIDLPIFPSFKETEKLRMNHQDYKYEPKTKTGEYTSKISEFGLGGGLFGKVPAVIGATGGAVDQALTDAYGQKTGIVGNIVTQIGLGIATRDPKALKLVKENLDDLRNTGKINEIKQIEEIAFKKYGIDLSVTESTKAVGLDTLDNLFQIGVNTKKGKNIFGNIFNNRKDQISDSQTKFLEEFFGDANLIPKNVTGKYVETINNAINNTRTRISNIARKKGYAQFDEIKDFDDTINIVIKEIETLSKLSKNVSNKSLYTDLAKKIKGGNQQNLQTVASELGDKIAKAKFDKNTTLARALTTQKNILDGALNSFEGYKNASIFYSKASEKILKPLEEAITSGGQISTKANADLNVIKKVLLNENVSPIEIQRLAKNLNKYDQNLFKEMAGLLMERTLGSVSKLKGNTYGSGLKSKVFKDENIKKNWEAIVKALAVNEGKNPIKAVKGFNEYFNILEGTSLPASNSVTNKLGQVGDEIIPNLNITNVAEYPIVKNILQAIADKRYGEIATALSGGIDDFISIANTSSKRTKGLIANTIINIIPRAERELN